MLAMRVLAATLFAVCCTASPLRYRQIPPLLPLAPSLSLPPLPEPSLSGLAVPSLSLSLSLGPAAPSEFASARSLSDSIQPSQTLVSESLSASESPSASAPSAPTLSPESVPPTPSLEPSTPEPSAPIVTPDPLPSVVVNKLPPSSVTRIITAEPSESAGSEAKASGNTSKSFWENQTAVIATFVIVGVAALALICMVFFFLRKRAVRKEQESLDDGFFEKFNDSHSDRSDSRAGHTSDQASVTDLHSQQPMAVRDYGSTNAALAPHLAFSGQSYAPYHYQDSSNYVRTDERSLDRPGSGDSFYGGIETTSYSQPHRVPRGY